MDLGTTRTAPGATVPAGAAPVGVRVTDRGDGVVTVALSGDQLAVGLNELRWRLGQLVPGSAHTVHLDLSELDHLSSACIATLLWVRRACTARHVDVVLVGAGGRSRDQLRRTGLGQVLQVAAS